MEINLKLTIFIVVLFGFIILGFALWRPMKAGFYINKLQNGDKETRLHALRILLNMKAKKPVSDYYTDRYSSKNAKERMQVVDELCECGSEGKVIMKEIFTNWCYSQQVKIPAGTLVLRNGSRIKIKSMYVNKYEVTIEKFDVFLKCSEYKIPSKPWSTRFLHDSLGTTLYQYSLDNGTMILEFPQESNYPVNNVEYFDAKAYANWLGMKLPTEYEWEYGARAGSIDEFCFGDNANLLYEYAWYKSNSGSKPHPVGEKKPNMWGLYDVHGNLGELCRPISINDHLISKGGSFYSDTVDCELSTHHSINYNVGFRCVRGTN